MLSKEIKQKIIDGEYAITRNGKKAKYIGKRSSPTYYPHCFAILNHNDEIEFCRSLLANFNNVSCKEGEFDVVGLWQDKPEPFDLERALAGELVKYSDKPCYVYRSNVTGLFWVEAQDGSFVDNDTPLEYVSEQGMWKEPEV